MDQLNLVGTGGGSLWRRLFPGGERSGATARGAGGKLVVIVVAVLVIAAGLVWWHAQRAEPVKYLTAPVTRGTVARTVVATGTVNPVLTVIVGSYVSGVISDMYCDYNTRVKKGQVCARIDARPYTAALDQAKGQLARDMAQLEGARINLGRYAILQDQDSIAKQTYDDQLVLVHQLTATVQLDRAAIETAQVNLGYTNIVSPVDGTVVARNITIGQTVAASFQTPTLFLIATDLTRMQVDTNVSESDIGAVEAGDEARFTVEAFAERSFEGRVSQVRQAPQTVQNVVTYDVVVEVDNPGFLLKPGMTATVGIVTDRRENVLRVPDQALRFTPGGLSEGRPAGGTQPAGGMQSADRDQPARGAQPTDGRSEGASRAARQAQVWVLPAAGAPVPVAITTGLDDDTYTEVVAGDLRADDQVIIGEQHAAATTQHTGWFRFGF